MNIAGLLCVGLAFIGVVLPGVPTTPFLLVAAACFAKASPKLHRWLLSNRLFGSLIRNWQETRTISRRAKRVSLAVLAFVGVYTLLTVEHPHLRFGLVLILGFPVFFLWRMKETEELV